MARIRDASDHFPALRSAQTNEKIGYRYFSVEMLRDIANCSYRHRWYSFEELKSAFRELAMDARGGTADDEIPS